MQTKITIPNYTLAEELISAISHGIGTGLAIAACVLCIVKGARDHVGAAGIVSAAIFGATMIFLYCMSTLYHSITAKGAKRVFRVIDHCSVFLLIAGTYTPFTLVSLLSFRSLAAAVSPRGVLLLLIGGLVYTVGAVFYGLGKRIRYMHSIWHFFVLGGTICHFFAVYLEVL